MGTEYADEKFTLAVHQLATNPKSIQERAAGVFAYHISSVRPQDLPDAVSEIATQLAKYRATWHKQSGETGRIHTWAENLSTGEAVEVARWILRAQDRIHRIL